LFSLARGHFPSQDTEKQTALLPTTWQWGLCTPLPTIQAAGGILGRMLQLKIAQRR
jgi:hypothetical protein